MDPQTLRNATAQEHRSVEQHMPLMDEGLTREVYAAVLAHIYPLLAGWEAWAQAHCPDSLRTLIEGRRREPLLASDLVCLGADVPAANGFDPGVIPGLAGEAAPAAFLGAMYVMEGSTLGGQYIARHVEPALGLADGSGTAYFRGYGSQTGAMWKQFQGAVRDRPALEDDEMITAAKAMFGVFESAILPLSTASRLS